jgi:hypothetical protein
MTDERMRKRILQYKRKEADTEEEDLGKPGMSMWSRNRRGCQYHGVKKKKKKIVRKYRT